MWDDWRCLPLPRALIGVREPSESEMPLASEGNMPAFDMPVRGEQGLRDSFGKMTTSKETAYDFGSLPCTPST